MFRRCSNNYRVWLCLLLCLLILNLVPLRLFAQAGDLSIRFQSTTIDRSIAYRDTSAGFPKWVMTLLTIKDSDSSYVHDLASRDRWLLPSDSTDLDTVRYDNVIVDSVWRRVYEYHVENEAYPVDPDVKSLDYPQYMVTEVTDIGVTLVLVMDYSGSISAKDRRITEEAASSLINRMHTNDKAAIVKFTGKVEVFQELTSNKTLLLEAINRPVNTTDFTSIFDAVYTGIDLCKDVEGRKVVITYSDGADNHSSHTKQDVINYSIEHSVPVYIAGIGVIDEATNPELHALHTSNLEDITVEPGLGGSYYADKDLAELAGLYSEILEDVSGYYVLATRSTDPYYDGTWRWIDIDIHIDDGTGTRRGQYYVPMLPVDISVDKNADITPNSSGKKMVSVNDTVTYSITLLNGGSSQSETYGDVNVAAVRMVDFPPDSLTPFDITPVPALVTADSLVWNITNLAPNEPMTFHYQCFIDTMRTDGELSLPNTATAEITGNGITPTQQDSVDSNNSDTETIYYMPPFPPEVSLSKIGSGDYNENEQIVIFRRDTAHYAVTVSNTGDWAANDIKLVDILPDSVIFIGSFSWDPADYTLSANGDTLKWTIPSLRSMQDTTFNYACLVDSTPPWTFQITNTVYSEYAFDGDTFSDNASTTMWVEGTTIPDPEIVVSRPVIEPGDTITFKVRSPLPINKGLWEIDVVYEDGTTNTSYFNAFIDENALESNTWLKLIPTYDQTRMVQQNKEEETIRVILTTYWDQWASYSFTADTSFKVVSPEEFFLSQNVYRTVEVDTLGMRFKLNSNRLAEIKIYDIAGGYITTAYTDDSWAGINRTVWDGRDESGEPAGSGLYVAILISEDFKAARKFVLVR